MPAPDIVTLPNVTSSVVRTFWFILAAKEYDVVSIIRFQAPQVVELPYRSHILPLSVNPNSFAPPPDQSDVLPYFLKYITPL